MKKLILGLLLAASISGAAFGQSVPINGGGGGGGGGSGPCSAFGTAVGTCLQGASDAGTPSALVGTNVTGVPLSTGTTGTLSTAKGGLGADNSAATGVPLFAAGTNTMTTTSGTGPVVRTTSPTLLTPNIGTPSAGVGTNITGVPISTGVSGLGTGVATGLGNNVTGSGAPVLATSPTLVTPNIGTPSAGVLTNATGLPPSTGLSAAVPVNKGGTNCTVAAVACVTAIGGFTGTPSATTYFRGDGTLATPAGSGSVTQVDTGACLSGGPITTTGTIVGTYVIRAVTGTTDTIGSGDSCKLVTYSNAAAVAVTLPQATGSFAAGFAYDSENKGAGAVTITPQGGSLINGAATLVMNQNTGCTIVSDGVNWQVSACTAIGASSGTVTSIALSAPGNVACSVSGSPVTTSGTLTCTPSGTSGGVPYFSSSSALSSSGALTANSLVIGGGTGVAPGTTTTGSGVLTALSNAVSAAGGVTSTIASGTSAMGTGAIASGACASAVTTSATNTATTDVVLASFNGDPTAVTGYVPLSTGMLTIISYPTTNNVNFKVCNNTSASISPGAITLNWRILR